MTTTLADLVEQLTKPHQAPVTRHGQLIGHRTRRPLLVVLADTATPTTDRTGTPGANGPRIAFDPAASELYTAIRTRIRGWAIDAGIPRHWTLNTGQPINWRNAADLLTAWHARAGHLDPAPYETVLHGWITAITDLVIDPPKRIPINAPCPYCGERWTILGNPNDPDTHERVNALRITVRDPATTSEITCRNRECGAHWTGLDGAEHLANQLHRAAS